MTGPTLAAAFVLFLGLTFVAWRRYLWVAGKGRLEQEDTCPYSLTDVFGGRHPGNVPHQEGVQWLTEIFSRSAARFPDLTALQIPHTGESLTFAELDARAEAVAAALSPFLTGPDQVVGVAMAQDNWQIVAAHLGILKAGGTVLFLDTTLPDALVTHMLEDARPVVVLTRGQDELPRPADPRCAGSARDEAAPRAATLAGRPERASRQHLLHERNHRDAQGGGVPARRLREPRLELRGLLRSRSGPGRHLAHVVPGIRRQHLRDVQRLGVGLCGGAADQGADPVRPGSRPRPPRGRGHRALLSAGAADHPHVDPRAGSPLPALPLRRSRGRSLPPALVEPWTRGRRQIINTYGPTEASTDTSRQSLRPGEPVTIGSPFPNVTYVILEVGELRPLPHGEAGELCIGGVHLARGYRNLPEETARKFITHPRFGRLYRTGDRCRIDIRTQRVQFLGRIDAQLKVRGHRVEVQPVEDLLQTQFSEIEAAVLDYQNQELVAFVTAPSVREGEIPVVAPAPAEWAARVRESLARQLPAPSVPTRIFLVEQFVLNPVSGKIDRKRLPDLSRLHTDAGAQAEEARLPDQPRDAGRPAPRRRCGRATGLRRGPGDLQGGGRPRVGMGRRLRRPWRTFDPDRGADGTPAGGGMEGDRPGSAQ